MRNMLTRAFLVLVVRRLMGEVTSTISIKQSTQTKSFSTLKKRNYTKKTKWESKRQGCFFSTIQIIWLFMVETVFIQMFVF